MPPRQRLRASLLLNIPGGAPFAGEIGKGPLEHYDSRARLRRCPATIIEDLRRRRDLYDIISVNAMGTVGVEKGSRGL